MGFQAIIYTKTDKNHKYVRKVIVFVKIIRLEVEKNISKTIDVE